MSKTTVKEIKTLDEVNDALGEIGRIQIELSRIDSEAEGKINAVKDKASQEGKPLREKIDLIEESLVAYGEKHQKEICSNGKRSIDLTFGTIGFRFSSKISIGKKEKTLELLRQLYDGRGIRTKEDVDKEELSKWTDEDLATVKAKRVTEDTFFSDINEEAVNKSLMKVG
jgi:phage host-nuclease inhibitor protein Gam